MQTCQVCGKDNPAGVEYCEDCGASLAGAGSTASGPSPSSSSPAPPSPVAPSPAGSSPAGGGVGSGTPAPTLADSPVTGSPTPDGSPVPAGAGDGAAAGATAPIPTGAEPGPAPAPPQAVGGQRPRLVIKRYGSLTGEEIPLLGERLVVGRFDPETGPVDIDLSSAPEAQHISRQHGELYREADGRWFVRDLGSTNGVFVKGEQTASFGPRITAPQPLAGGDEVAFGNARFVFRTD